MSKTANIWSYLKAGKTLTTREAYVRFGTLTMHSRAAELRKRGHTIDCRMVKRNGKPVWIYSMPRKGR